MGLVARHDLSGRIVLVDTARLHGELFLDLAMFKSTHRASCSRQLYLPHCFAYAQFAISHTSSHGSYHHSVRWISTCDTRQTTIHDASGPKSFLAAYLPIEDIEPFERYAPGGYYPVRIDEQFASSRYRIVHKLGYGASSTTWLALDKHSTNFVAMKFAVAELRRPFGNAILKILRGTNGRFHDADAGITIIPELLDEFQVEGPDIHGIRRKHHCLVTTLARMSISEARDASYNRLFQPLVARAIAAQLIQAIAFMHSRGVVHADLHEANILLRLPNSIDNLTPDQLYQKYGQPELEEITRLDGKPLDPWVPTHGVVAVWLGGASDTISLADSHVFLTDFSESFRPAVDVHQVSHTPFALRSPEMLLEPKSHVTFAAEIWSLACAVFAIIGQRPLFDTWFPTRDKILDEHVDTLGCLPREWWESWVNRHECFDDQLERVDGAPRRLLEHRLEYSVQEPRKEAGMAEMKEQEKQEFLALLRSMLSFVPEDRPSAQQVVESSWMQKWAIPALELTKDIQVLDNTSAAMSRTQQ
ncbi:hypothetical protein HBH98_203070 [Parastagonospora nodorum]|nr:hypothetical protein HBI06_070810 [Parastagonospora nodorum]KAH4246787.1 hypothetical protein HBI05_054030 [Parastagonospora nodorum]KAH4339723.1 hypothetical protein HBH98_203070 [Parastagonospora nodorum]KAH4358937.1 hypothetical protein HBH97_214630 [Parastagonospora nodorum]KAH4383089.1 hypothetical protein HBH99_187100 [Parastagonospora nodorum]